MQLREGSSSLPTVAWCAFAGGQWCARRPLTSTYAQLALAAQPRDAAGVLDPACAPCLGLCGPAPVKAVVPGLGFRACAGRRSNPERQPHNMPQRAPDGSLAEPRPYFHRLQRQLHARYRRGLHRTSGPLGQSSRGSHPSRLGLAVRPSQPRSGGHQYLITSLTSGAASVLHNDSAAQAFSRGSMHAFNPSRM